jgi:hypothetical protein
MARTNLVASATAILLAAGGVLTGCGPASAQGGGQKPDWMSQERLAVLPRIGIDPKADLKARGNYHWRWRAKRQLSAGGYSCPAGSSVDISRNIILIMAPETSPCSDPAGHRTGSVKVNPDGSADPLG